MYLCGKHGYVSTASGAHKKTVVAGQAISGQANGESDYYKFVVLRNPFEQEVSLYNQIRVSANIPSLEHFILGEKNFTMKQVDHYIDQYKFTHIDGELMVDKIFVFDRYHEAQNFVEEKFNLKNGIADNSRNYKGLELEFD